MWLTYAIIIIMILSIIAIGIFVYIIRNPIVDRQAIQKLDLALRLMQRQLNERNIYLPQTKIIINRITESFSIRAVLFDPQKEQVLDTDPTLSDIIWPGENLKALRGRIEDQSGKTWLFTSMKISSGETLVLTTPRQGGIQLIRSPQLKHILTDDFMPSFLRAGLLAFILAILFAAWMGNWIISPLKEIEIASKAVSKGEYRQINPQGPDEVIALAESYNDMVDRVQSFQQSQRDFVANVSHELKTPLTSIQGFSQAIQDGTVGSAEELNKAAGIIHLESERMYRLVVNLLDLASFDAGTVALDRKALDLNRLITHVVEQMKPQAVDARVRLEMVADPLPTCVGDSDRLAQVFTNLVDNAIKHTPQNGFVKVTAYSDGGSAIIDVLDSGDGIPEEHLSRIFERFYKVDGSRKKDNKPGTGLGLAIAQQIVKAHGGTISVRSKVGEGSEFQVTFPIVRSDDLTIADMREYQG